MTKIKDIKNLDRVEVINHSGEREQGRVFTLHSDEDKFQVQLHEQNGGKTVKLFIK